MKHYAKYLIGLAAVAVVAVLVMVNRNSVQEDIDRAAAKQLPVILNGVEQIYEYSEEDPAYVEFDAQMRKKNGDVYDNQYAGLPLQVLHLGRGNPGCTYRLGDEMLESSLEERDLVKKVTKKN